MGPGTPGYPGCPVTLTFFNPDILRYNPSSKDRDTLFLFHDNNFYYGIERETGREVWGCFISSFQTLE